MAPTIFERRAPLSSAIDAALETSINRPFWTEDAGPRQMHPPLRERRHANLAIVGGGYLGLWSALLAKERYPELDIVLLEADRIGAAASGRNGGFCEASLTHGEVNATKHWPEEADQLRRLGERNLDEFEEAIRRYEIDCDFERTGTLNVAVESYQVAQCYGPEYLSRDEVRAELASPIFLSGSWERDSGALLHPGKLAAGLARVLDDLGVRLCENSPVRGLSGDKLRVRVECATGVVEAERVILATNAFPALLRRYRKHTVPVYDYVLMTEPLSGAQMESIGWKHRQGVADLGNRFHYYRLTRENRILFGGYDAIYHFGGKLSAEYEDRPESFRKLASHFLTTFPQLAGVRFTHRWAGVIDTSTRFCAFFGQAYRGRVAHAAGFTGLGVGATRFAANVLLDKVFGLDTERTRLRMVQERPMPFPPEPLAYAAITTVQKALARADSNGGRRGALLRTLDALGLGFDS
jgi:glycine/D-amino acid oxidase-like deaminating enzyme